MDNDFKKIVILSVLGSESGVNHRILLENDHNINLLEAKEIDELGLKLLANETKITNILNEYSNNVTNIEF